MIILINIIFSEIYVDCCKCYTVYVYILLPFIHSRIAVSSVRYDTRARVLLDAFTRTHTHTHTHTLTHKPARRLQ